MPNRHAVNDRAPKFTVELRDRQRMLFLCQALLHSREMSPQRSIPPVSRQTFRGKSASSSAADRAAPPTAAAAMKT